MRPKPDLCRLSVRVPPGARRLRWFLCRHDREREQLRRMQRAVHRGSGMQRGSLYGERVHRRARRLQRRVRRHSDEHSELRRMRPALRRRRDVRRRKLQGVRSSDWLYGVPLRHHLPEARRFDDVLQRIGRHSVLHRRQPVSVTHHSGVPH